MARKTKSNGQRTLFSMSWEDDERCMLTHQLPTRVNFVERLSTVHIRKCNEQMTVSTEQKKSLTVCDFETTTDILGVQGTMWAGLEPGVLTLGRRHCSSCCISYVMQQLHSKCSICYSNHIANAAFSAAIAQQKQHLLQLHCTTTLPKKDLLPHPKRAYICLGV